MPNLIKILRGMLALALLAVFSCGIIPLGPLDASIVEARAKKAAKKKIKQKKKKIRKSKKAVRRVARKPKTLYQPPVYRLPARASTLSQKYYLEEAVNDAQSENIVDGLKSLGVDEASTDAANKAVQVKYSTQALNSISIIKRLKELGFTVRRID